MYIIVQSVPEEKILFASNSEVEANNFFNLQVQHGKGWFELWQEGEDLPIEVDGEQLFAPNSLDN